MIPLRALVVTALLLSPLAASAERLSLDQLTGSGVTRRSVADDDGLRHRAQLLSLRVQLTRWLSTRAGVGPARLEVGRFGPTQDGIAFSGGASLTMWRAHGLSLSVDVGAMRSRYQDRAMTEGSLMLALRHRL